METVRFLFALAPKKGWSLFHLDIKSAFLNGEMSEEVYVEQTIVFEVEREHEKVYRLKKSFIWVKPGS